MINFYFFFTEDANGRTAQRMLEQQGYGLCGYHLLEELDPPIWSLMVQRDISSDEFFEKMEEIEGRLSSIAEECGGRYDGHEFELRQ